MQCQCHDCLLIIPYVCALVFPCVMLGVGPLFLYTCFTLFFFFTCVIVCPAPISCTCVQLPFPVVCIYPPSLSVCCQFIMLIYNSHPSSFFLIIFPLVSCPMFCDSASCNVILPYGLCFWACLFFGLCLGWPNVPLCPLFDTWKCERMWQNSKILL